MSFEQAILGTVATTIGNDKPAGFTCGSLFVECTAEESNTLLEVLQKNYTGKLYKVGPIQGEYAYDFM
jgi:hypothetical protein